MKLCTGQVPGEPGSVPPQKAAARGPLGRDCAPPGRATLPRSLIPRLTSADRRAEDSLHLVVMDAHQALNRLIGELGGRQERIGNADALGLTPDDRRLVEAFSDGVSSTLHLKGGHPGLGTTAVRAGARLLLQNDIGETEAHVILIEVGERELEITYTDVHEKRVEFFLNLLRDIPVRWKKTETRSGSVEEGGFLLVRGKLSFPDLAAAARILRTIGANLVFLIDWNRARKKLRNFLKGSDSREVLSWSSRERIGHLPFIGYGDEELIYEALEALPRGTVRRGEPLSSILGRRGAVEFIQETLRLARESYDRQEPRTLLVDRLRCALLARAGKRGRQAEEDLEEMAVLAVECALVFRDALRAVSRPVPGLLGRSHGRVTAWEERADERLNRIRKLHLKDPRVPLSAAALVDDALDALEDGCDLARALAECFRPGDLPGDLVEVLERSAEETLRAAQLFLRILCLYRRLLRGGTGERLFQLINELKVAEHAGDALKRTFRWRWLAAQGPPRALDALRDLQDRVEEALNALARSGFAVHDLAYRAMENPHG